MWNIILLIKIITFIGIIWIINKSKINYKLRITRKTKKVKWNSNWLIKLVKTNINS